MISWNLRIDGIAHEKNDGDREVVKNAWNA